MIYDPCHDNDVWVDMTNAEIDAAVREGVRQRQYSVEHNHRNRCDWYDPDEDKGRRIQALGELCHAIVCKALGVPIVHRPQTYKTADVLNNIQVRLIGAEHYGLRVYNGDHDDWCVVGVVIRRGQERAGRYRIPGWYEAGLAKFHSDEWRMMPYGPPPMIVVPQKYLRKLEV